MNSGEIFEQQIAERAQNCLTAKAAGTSVDYLVIRSIFDFLHFKQDMDVL